MPLSVWQWSRLAASWTTGPPADLTVNVSEAITVTDVGSPASTLLIVSAVETLSVTESLTPSFVVEGGDALQRRSMVSVTLPYLRGGILPTGSGLDTDRERQYADGLYTRSVVVGGDLNKAVYESLTITEVVSTSGVGGGVSLVPVLIPSYRRRRMV